MCIFNKTTQMFILVSNFLVLGGEMDPVVLLNNSASLCKVGRTNLQTLCRSCFNRCSDFFSNEERQNWKIVSFLAAKSEVFCSMGPEGSCSFPTHQKTLWTGNDLTVFVRKNELFFSNGRMYSRPPWILICFSSADSFEELCGSPYTVETGFFEFCSNLRGFWFL